MKNTHRRIFSSIGKYRNEESRWKHGDTSQSMKMDIPLGLEKATDANALCSFQPRWSWSTNEDDSDVVVRQWYEHPTRKKIAFRFFSLQTRLGILFYRVSHPSLFDSNTQRSPIVECLLVVMVLISRICITGESFLSPEFQRPRASAATAKGNFVRSTQQKNSNTNDNGIAMYNQAYWHIWIL